MVVPHPTNRDGRGTVSPSAPGLAVPMGKGAFISRPSTFAPSVPTVLGSGFTCAATPGGRGVNWRTGLTSPGGRPERHRAGLQSPLYLECRLLLETTHE